jgi:hypothetical protein
MHFFYRCPSGITEVHLIALFSFPEGWTLLQPRMKYRPEGGFDAIFGHVARQSSTWRMLALVTARRDAPGLTVFPQSAEIVQTLMM